MCVRANDVFLIIVLYSDILFRIFLANLLFFIMWKDYGLKYREHP